ncbi:MAG TPA: type VI secretion system baseplate subunit TssG [Acidobacteriota bacterium]|nr:type VI secretion system baseplate subunit TssG [Acidobacteriota bacterium]
MVATQRKPAASVTTQLAAEPCQFSFFQAIRLLERIFPDREPIGLDSLPAQEVVRLHSAVSLAFPASEIASLNLPLDAESTVESPVEMTVAFMGLGGPLGVLPTCYTEELVTFARNKETALAEFFDLFNHRLISFFYRAWEKYHFLVGFERNGADLLTLSLCHLVGLGTQNVRNRLSIPDHTLLYYGGLVTQNPPSAIILEAIVGDYFGIPVEVVPNIGRWLELEPDGVTVLGVTACTLGGDMVAGSRIWDQQSAFRLRLGPLSLREYASFLPNGSRYHPLHDLVRFYVGIEFTFEVQLVLKAAEVPDFVCQSDLGDCFLSWTTWLKSAEFDQADDQVILYESEYIKQHKADRQNR